MTTTTTGSAAIAATAIGGLRARPALGQADMRLMIAGAGTKVAGTAMAGTKVAGTAMAAMTGAGTSARVAVATSAKGTGYSGPRLANVSGRAEKVSRTKPAENTVGSTVTQAREMVGGMAGEMAGIRARTRASASVAYAMGKPGGRIALSVPGHRGTRLRIVSAAAK